MGNDFWIGIDLYEINNIIQQKIRLKNSLLVEDPAVAKISEREIVAGLDMKGKKSTKNDCAFINKSIK